MAKTNRKISLTESNKKYLYHVLDNKGSARRLHNGDLLATIIGAVVATSINEAMSLVNQQFGHEISATVIRIKEIN